LGHTLSAVFTALKGINMTEKQKMFDEAMAFRHACKLFDETKTIKPEDMEFILEAGRKSPSSFGMEPWKFLVITNEALKTKLRPLCWDQVQITSCSHLVVLLATIENVKVRSGVPHQRFARRELGEEMTNAYMQRYASHLEQTLGNDDNIFAWTSKQTYIAAANMMSAAACVGIDSCPIEGFEREDVEAALGLDTSKWRLSLVIPFGYRTNPQSKQLREPLNEIVEFID
jgi:nitroreductase